MAQTVAQILQAYLVDHIDHERLHQHLAGLSQRYSTATHIEQRGRVELPRRGPVGTFHVIIVDKQLRLGVHPCPGGGKQVAVALVRLIETRPVGDLDKPLERA